MTHTNADTVRSETSGTAPDSPATCERVRLSGLPPSEAEAEALMERLSRCPCCSGAPVLGFVPMEA
jgi:formate dehydrogenase maturation protein FdhE